MTYVGKILPSLLNGTKVTLWLFIITLILSIPLGVILSWGLRSHFKPLQWLLHGYVWLMRGTPLLLQLIFIFYGLPTIGVVFERFTAAVVAFTLNYAAYFAEIFRGGLQAVSQDQREAAAVLGLSRWQAFRFIVWPQVMKIVLPSIGNEVINLIKDSSLVYVLGIGDLLRAGNVATARDVTLIPLVLVGIIYLIMTAVLTFIQTKIEQRYSYYE
ncbi:Ectoine/hydroxyectoine ABC transporter, permease EhuD [Bombilactobacillus mellis]|uniref:Ectoine/hydroxyectoine ABC transporter, permease EhuD n=1 Tax=Bombilactobacillus mellis TaxID=1218508 RepID=A0A0F4KPP2_9LACO|nr:amino acid ABC transporter permease [Bombilactobacillus mellis]MBI0107342.1 amino acid ABC transporter permease [Lactobacillus sp. W8086]MBI0108807.1 amino acid ABC transporter permease [Lactobacillus sp. W8085]MBI0112024.1 amino acid ABC transporter permease [Lactobacillus sp. W8088]MBI0115740.1 amino acid ABC transporter permease [Lactobacillus sp. W8087]MBI0119464.1 amino acid ABC transporter permease [Lactobacillus sp. W8089]MBI0131430.1 amino acid ABC transporter permease [Lactobacill